MFKKKTKKEEAPRPILEKVEVNEVKKANGVRVIVSSNGQLKIQQQVEFQLS